MPTPLIAYRSANLAGRLTVPGDKSISHRALIFGGLLPVWLGIGAAVLGVAAMALTMGLPDSLDLYKTIFHLNAVWLAALGVTVLGMA